MTRPSNELNLEHYLNPQAGDVWAEMMCVYHIVLDVTENNRLIIAEKDLTVKEGQTFDFVNAKEISQDEHRKLITYNGNIDETKGPTFVADVMVDNRIAKSMVELWKKEYHGKYKPYTEEIETNETVVSESPNKETEVSVKRSADGTLSPTDKQIVNVILRTGTPEDKFKLLVSLGVIEGDPEPTEENIQYANKLIDAFLEIVL